MSKKAPAPGFGGAPSVAVQVISGSPDGSFDERSVVSSIVEHEHGQQPLTARYLMALFAAQFSLYIALVSPGVLSLPLRVEQLDPAGKASALSLAIGIPAVLALVVSPIVGVLSDRTMSRFGRRRPWIFVGVLLGLVGMTLIGFAPAVEIVILGWAIAFLGYSACAAMILAHFGDRLPEQQRGRVMGINGALTQIAPIAGILISGGLAMSPSALFLVPAAIAGLGILIFLAVMKDPQLVDEPPALSGRELLKGYWFNPRQFPNLAWVCLSKAFVFFNFALAIYAVYLLTGRLGLSAAEVASIVSLTSLAAVVTAIAGALGSGYLSDRIGTRKPFLVVSALIMASGSMAIATTDSITQFIVGTLIGSFGIGIYGAVDQALILDVLPEGGAENGRYLAITGLANQIPQAIGPLAAGAVVGLASGNYAIAYIVAGASAALGALAIIPVKTGRRAKSADRPSEL
ncbi:MFS transporter [Paenarthrobacter nicotinovorans]|uniref:MFS transporter n=1 Tax=Paenarthrobacter nicotinovorans TaxID=29320 RepID=UPI0037481FFD